MIVDALRARRDAAEKAEQEAVQRRTNAYCASVAKMIGAVAEPTAEEVDALDALLRELGKTPADLQSDLGALHQLAQIRKDHDPAEASARLQDALAARVEVATQVAAMRLQADQLETEAQIRVQRAQGHAQQSKKQHRAAVEIGHRLRQRGFTAAHTDLLAAPDPEGEKLPHRALEPGFVDGRRVRRGDIVTIAGPAPAWMVPEPRLWRCIAGAKIDGRQVVEGEIVARVDEHPHLELLTDAEVAAHLEQQQAAERAKREAEETQEAARVAAEQQRMQTTAQANAAPDGHGLAFLDEFGGEA